MENSGTTKWVRIGDYIDVYDRKNEKGYDYPFYGVNKDKSFMPTMANTLELDRKKYKLVSKDVFAINVMHVGRDVAIPIALYKNDTPVLISPAYTTFKVKEPEALLPEYLFIQFNRDESGRYGWFLCDNSIRGNLDWDRFCDIEIPLPSIEVQRELVEVYNGLRTIAEQNEALIEPITKACEAFIIDCKNRFPEVTLAKYIVASDERNTSNVYAVNELRGVTNEGIFDTSKANTIGLNFSNYKIVRKGSFAYNPARINIGSIAYNDESTFIVSPMYCAFAIKSEYKEILNPKFLNLWFRRKEFQRSTLFFATGSVRDIFDFNLMGDVKIPLPPINVQQSIINVFECLEQSKKIAAEAREKLKNLCPALVQRAANS